MLVLTRRQDEKGEQMKQVGKGVLLAIVVATISGCVTSSGVFSTGKDTFTIVETSITYPANMGTLKKGAYEKANAYCEQRGKVMQPIATETMSDRFELQFRALDPSDPEVSRPTLEPAADTKIDVNVH